MSDHQTSPYVRDLAPVFRRLATHLAEEVEPEVTAEIALVAALLLHLEDRVPKGASKRDAKASWMRAASDLWDSAVSQLNANIKRVDR